MIKKKYCCVDNNKLKGIKKSVVKKEIKFTNYYRSLMGESKAEIQQRSKFNVIRSTNHVLHSMTVNKVGICSADDKRYLLNHIDTLAYGHYKTNVAV